MLSRSQIPATQLRPIPNTTGSSVGDFRRYPGCRLMLRCGVCSWAKHYDPERVIDRLRELRAGGYATRLMDAAKRVAWPCPACSRTRWYMQFAWPPGLDEREFRRLANRYRN